jgi:mono/diheme cytochrome c family protein
MTCRQSLVAALVALGVSAAGVAAPVSRPAATDPAAVPAVFRGADLALGERLIRENRCSQCHASQVGGDGSDIYDPGGKVRTPGALVAMVQGCATTLNLPWFPEEVAAVAAVLNRDHYHFGP